MTKAQATAYAHAVNLRAADLPAMSASSAEGEGKAPGSKDRALARCARGVSPDLRIVDIHSATFSSTSEGEHEGIHSDVEVMPTPTLAARHNAAQLSRRGIACLKRFILLPRDKPGSRLHYGPVTVSPPSQLPGVSGGFTIEFTTTIVGVPTQVEPTPPHVYIDAAGFVSGAAEVAITAIGFPKPVPAEVEQRLLSLLYSRAQAHEL
jgi:hypothetical protein